MRKVRTCLFGLGHMGRNHLRTLQAEPGIELVAVVDPLTSVLPEGTQPVPLLKTLPSDLDCELAVVAAPTELHYQLVGELLERGLHVLVEKPAAATHEQASELVRKAAERQLKLAVGNIERCNPVVSALRAIIESGILGTLVHLNGLRAGGWPRNVKPGNNVILDLAVHELDVFRTLLGPLTIQQAVGHASLQPGIYDFAEISLRAQSGVTGTVQVNWLSPERLRSIRVTGTSAVCHVDYLKQSCEIVGLNLSTKAPQLSWSRDANGLERAQWPVIVQESLKVQLKEMLQYLSGEPHHLAIQDELIESVSLVEQSESKVKLWEAAQQQRGARL